MVRAIDIALQVMMVTTHGMLKDKQEATTHLRHMITGTTYVLRHDDEGQQ